MINWTQPIEKPPSLGFLPFRGDKLDITVKGITPSGEIGFDYKFREKLISRLDIFGRNYQRCIVNVTTKKVHRGLSGNNRL